MIEVRFALDGEAEAATDLLRGVAQWLVDRGEALWSPEWFSCDSTLAHIAAGELVVAGPPERILGAMLFQLEDTEFWPERARGEAAYLHRLAVRREAAGRGVADALITWAADEARRRGLGRLRLDCAQRAPLVALYERLGFGRVDAGHRGDLAVFRYERTI